MIVELLFVLLPMKELDAFVASLMLALFGIYEYLPLAVPPDFILVGVALPSW